MPKNHPLGLTGFELRELAGHPHAWEEMEDVVAIERRVQDCPDWIITGRFYAGSHGLQLLSLTIEAASLYPWPPRQPLNTAVVRSVHLADLHRRARAAMAAGQQIGIGVEMEASEFRLNRRPGKAGRPDMFYVRMVVRYLQLVETTSSPTKSLAAEIHESQSTTRDIISEARRRRLLSRTRRGVAGGQLTRKALRLLEADKDAAMQPNSSAKPDPRQAQPPNSKSSKSSRPKLKEI